MQLASDGGIILRLDGFALVLSFPKSANHTKILMEFGTNPFQIFIKFSLRLIGEFLSNSRVKDFIEKDPAFCKAHMNLSWQLISRET